eukprot:CAMPEP_0195522646 /NCGR_PEP_ID=MMETSP0794_2-20130614/21007_1 /TAXON_ID=515487 /ORGANISM="Stephanopyxis turris, Strain CCMP 815" /LENGTH=213 /DNA_ID=CAMNT_0040652449 /DNA_START=203 /DNA_END=844 /DNA_ORIENTATION=-
MTKKAQFDAHILSASSLWKGSKSKYANPASRLSTSLHIQNTDENGPESNSRTRINITDNIFQAMNKPQTRKDSLECSVVSNVKEITSAEDFLEFLGEDSRLVVVKFHASWCTACRRLDARFRKVAHDYGDQIDAVNNYGDVEDGPVRFCAIEYSRNEKLCRTLGVERIPAIHMYRKGEGKLCGFVCEPKDFKTVLDKIEHFLERTKDGEKIVV